MHGIEVIYFATLFLPLDTQTPSSSPTSGEHDVFFFSFLNVSFGENFNWGCPNLSRISLIFINPFFSQLRSYLLCHSISTRRYPSSIIFTDIRWARCVLFEFSSMSVLEQILTVSKLIQDCIDFYQSYFSRQKFLLLVFVYHWIQLQFVSKPHSWNFIWTDSLRFPLTPLHFNTPPHPYPYSHPLPLVEKQITFQP